MVLISAVSKMHENGEDIRPFYFQFMRKLNLLIAPLGVGVFVFRDLFTAIMLGDQWTEAATFIGLWALTYSLRIMFGYFNGMISMR